MKKAIYYLMLMVTVLTLPALFTSCKDDEPDGKNKLVGTWYCVDDETGEVCLDEYIIFKADGTIINWDGEKMTYRYEASTDTIYLYDGEDWWEEDLVFIDDNTISIDGWIYKRLK